MVALKNACIKLTPSKEKYYSNALWKGIGSTKRMSFNRVLEMPGFNDMLKEEEERFIEEMGNKWLTYNCSVFPDAERLILN